ncbi:hypothetical protein SAMN02910275_02452 [Butyrivibrio sp. INlla18]|uniref:hypothetical protein n=1 Tax=Butyrivibrio sp. INlla18 TaxID=1520806 RepID=UPI0008805FA2|nr:hypothetical protein [Butyrivibrio sp. INlla18]SDA73170.1 hypothetical protein SAMN02910275_02452 [Butyrivibrio sp. INlla18]
MLFVLDNLETINTEDIKGFLDRFTEYGKVLIALRVGLGEMEHRYKMGGMSKNDVLEYMNYIKVVKGLGLKKFERYINRGDNAESCTFMWD